MIRPEALGELKDGAAGLVALSELLASRRVGPKAIAAALAPAGEACAAVAAAADALAAEVIAVVGPHGAAAAEIQAAFDRAVTAVRALEAEVASSRGEPAEARTRLVLERAAHAAAARVAAGLFVAELFVAAASPRVVSVRVADVLGFGPPIGEGPSVIRATLDVPPGPVATTDARLLRGLVELAVQIVAEAGVAAPHIQVTSGPTGGAGARIRVGEPPTAGSSVHPGTGARRGSRPPPPETGVLAVRRLPWDQAREIARAAGAMAGVQVSIDPSGRGLSAVFS